MIVQKCWNEFWSECCYYSDCGKKIQRIMLKKKWMDLTLELLDLWWPVTLTLVSPWIWIGCHGDGAVSQSGKESVRWRVVGVFWGCRSPKIFWHSIFVTLFYVYDSVNIENLIWAIYIVLPFVQSIVNYIRTMNI